MGGWVCREVGAGRGEEQPSTRGGSHAGVGGTELQPLTNKLPSLPP